MADLNELQAADSIKIVGSNSSGTETSPINSVGDSLKVIDIVNGGGTQGSLTVGTSAVLANVSGSNLTNRTNLTIFNNSSSTIYWGYNNSVTTSNGTPIFKNQFLSLDVGANTNIYLISSSAGQNTRITEGAL